MSVIDMSLEEWEQLALERGWSDGLPLAPPREEVVQRIVHAIGLPDDAVVGRVGPRGGAATVREIAIQCAMAGCRDIEGPVVVAALQAALTPSFNLHGMQCTTNPCAPLIVVSGPITLLDGFNASYGAFGGGGRRTVAVGRAMRLIMWNLGQGRPGVNDMAPLGDPAKLAYCVAETYDKQVWPSIHTDTGLPNDASAVTVFGCTGPFPVVFSPNVESMLGILAESLPRTSTNAFHAAGQVMVVLTQEPARMLARAGFDRSGFKQWLWENARYELGRLRRFGILEDRVSYWRASSLVNERPELAELPDQTLLPMVRSPEDFLLLVTGGDTQMWGGYCPGWGSYGGPAECRRIEGSGWQELVEALPAYE